MMIVRVPTKELKESKQQDQPQTMNKKQTMEKPSMDSSRKKTNSDKPSSSASKQDNQLTQKKSTTTNMTSLTLTAPPIIVWILLVTWMFYVVIWHAVLSNLPLSSPMGYAVHSRFWMQVMMCHYYHFNTTNTVATTADTTITTTATTPYSPPPCLAHPLHSLALSFQ